MHAHHLLTVVFAFGLVALFVPACVGVVVSIDWTQKESVKAKLRVIVKRILRKHGYPPDRQEAATVTVLEQAELLSESWLHGS
jgi:Domain of unknown function (DUF3387)